MLLKDRLIRGHRWRSPRHRGSVLTRRSPGDAPDEIAYVLVREGQPSLPAPFPAARPVAARASISGPGGPAAGWCLLALHGGDLRWSLPLAARGAAPAAAVRVAKAVALRVLREHGVAVSGWCGAGADHEPKFRAAVIDPSVPGLLETTL